MATEFDLSNFDEDAVTAAADLVGRTGARSLEIGHLEEDVPVEEARWWAKAQYRGGVVQVAEQRGPIEAIEALARRLLRGAACASCGRMIFLGGDSTAGCRWRRKGAAWEPGCAAGQLWLARRAGREGRS